MPCKPPNTIIETYHLETVHRFSVRSFSYKQNPLFPSEEVVMQQVNFC